MSGGCPCVHLLSMCAFVVVEWRLSMCAFGFPTLQLAYPTGIWLVWVASGLVDFHLACSVSYSLLDLYWMGSFAIGWTSGHFTGLLCNVCVNLPRWLAQQVLCLFPGQLLALPAYCLMDLCHLLRSHWHMQLVFGLCDVCLASSVHVGTCPAST